MSVTSAGCCYLSNTILDIRCRVLYDNIIKNENRQSEFTGVWQEGSPYHGAKPHFLIEELEDRERLAELVQVTCRELPMPKPKKKKGAADGTKGAK